MQTRQCADCGHDLTRPHEQHANYVTSPRFSDTEPVEVTYALTHTSETRTHLNQLAARLPERDEQALAAEIAHPDAPATIEVDAGRETVTNENGAQIETRAVEEVEFSLPMDAFEQVEIDTPNAVQDDADIAFTYTTTEPREVEKTGLCCSDCTDSEQDTILWGVDK